MRKHIFKVQADIKDERSLYNHVLNKNYLYKNETHTLVETWRRFGRTTLVRKEAACIVSMVQNNLSPRQCQL